MGAAKRALPPLASFSMTAMRLPCCCVRMWLSSVVLPEPRNPVTTWGQGAGEWSGAAYRRRDVVRYNQHTDRRPSGHAAAGSHSPWQGSCRPPAQRRRLRRRGSAAWLALVRKRRAPGSPSCCPRERRPPASRAAHPWPLPWRSRRHGRRPDAWWCVQPAWHRSARLRGRALPWLAGWFSASVRVVRRRCALLVRCVGGRCRRGTFQGANQLGRGFSKPYLAPCGAAAPANGHPHLMERIAAHAS